MRAREFVLIVEGYREAEQEFAQVTDADAVKKMIDAYRSLVDRNQVQGPERNIDHWRKQGWDQFSQFVQSKSQERSKTQVKRARGITTQQITLRDDNDWLIVIPLDKDTSCFHGRGTDWCTTKASQSHFENYFYKNNVTLIYCINSQTGGKWAIAAHHKTAGRAEYFDQQDRKLTAEVFEQKTGLNSAQIIQQALSQQNIGVADSARIPYRDAIRRLDRLDYLSPRHRSPEEKQEIEQLLLFVKDIQRILDYAAKVIQGRWPAAEPMFMRDPEQAYYYARNIIKGRWPEAEPAIAKDPKSAYYYARTIIKGPWPEAEPAIAKKPEWAYGYAKDIIKGPWPEAEPWIAKKPELAYYYAKDVIKKCWPEAEPAIATDPEWAYHYARDIIKGRWPAVEPAIAKDPRLAYGYAKDIIKKRWPAAEPWIAKKPELAYYYAKDVIKKRWPEAEPAIAKKTEWAYYYARDIIKGRWPEAEPAIAKDPKSAYRYAKDIIKGPWPEAGINEI